MNRASLAADLALEQAYQRRFGLRAKAPALFTDFCEWLGVALEPGQRVIARVAYDGVDPVDLPESERAIALEIFGGIDRFTRQARDVIVVVCGGRGGKTYILVALRVLHLSLTVSLSTLAPGEVASAPIIAPGKELATQALRYIQGAVIAKPELAALVVGKPDAAESIELKRDNGGSVEIVVRAASARGRTGRGRSLVCAVMDEAAFFYDATYQVNDREIYLGLSPRVLPGGQMIIDSTPWAQSGLLYDLFAANHPNPERAGLPPRPEKAGTAMAVHATTLRLRDTPAIRDIVAREEKRDPENAAREFGAQFMSAGTADFFEPACLEACLDFDLQLPLARTPGVEVVAGADMGFTKNSSALCVGHIRGGVATVAELVERKPLRDEPLKPAEVATEFAKTVAGHGGTHLMVDGHYIETVREHATPVGLAVIDAPASPAEAFIAVRARMREARFRIPNNPRFLRQLRETKSRVGSGGNVTIILPKWKSGEHGDLVSAFINMGVQTCGAEVPALRPKPGTKEAAQAEEKRLLDADIEKYDAEREDRLREERYERMFG